MVVSKLEKAMGIEVYVTSSQGIGGKIREHVDDFAVEELLVDGSRAEINPHSGDPSQLALGSSLVRNRYLVCVMVKRNWDTLSVMKVLARHLGIDMNQVHVGGMKDAKAVTAQYISIDGVSIEEVQRVKVKDLEIRPIGYFRNKLSSYYVLGNGFFVTIKSVRHSESTVKERIAQTVGELRLKGGVPNFFGHQRFGTARPITHLVGKEMVKGDFRKALMLFLAEPSPNEHPSSRRAREELQISQDFKQALRDFPKQLHYERSMLRRLAQKPLDYVGAFGMLPRKLQELFVQAYQSYLFNRFLSRRVTAGLGLDEAEVGDYVVHVERSGLPMVTMHKLVNTAMRTEINKAIMTGKMRLALPLVGFKQCASQGIQGEIEKRTLEEEDIALDNFRIKTMPLAAGKGQLRAAVTPLNDFSSDGLYDASARRLGCDVKASFMLYRGSYATIVLREIMKPGNLLKAGF